MAERRTDTELNVRLEIIERQLNQILQYEAARVEREKNVNESISKLKETINGNGKPGLKADMQLMKDQIGRINWASAIFAGAILIDIANSWIKP